MLEYIKFGLLFGIAVIHCCWSIESPSAAQLVTQHNIHKRQSNTQCDITKFRCRSGACINKNRICDGLWDCNGGDDESFENCKDHVCSNAKFRCKSGACFDKQKVCDGTNNCIDGEDETFEHCKDNICNSTKFRCKSGSCIDKQRICDGEWDCKGGDDESFEICKSNTCSSTKFRCKSGACFEKKKVCDGINNCIDGEDETSEYCKNNVCDSKKFRCKSGSCIEKQRLCDGEWDCNGGDDEAFEHCKNHTCSNTKFRCKSGACFDRKKLCDGMNNCIDGEDETSEHCKDNVCDSTKFQCKSGACIDKQRLCDGEWDCKGGDDESFENCVRHPCARSKFHCKSGACFDKKKLCDGINNCIDGEDETFEHCKDNVCNSTKFRCKSGACIEKQRLCDGEWDCQGGDDETFANCKDHVCSSTKFRCKSGACFDIKKVCNGINNCIDGEDETFESCQNQNAGASAASPTTRSPSSATSAPSSTTIVSDRAQCILPPATPDKTYTIRCPTKEKFCGMKPGETVPEFTPIISQCISGYARYLGDKISDSALTSICLNGSWTPEVTGCKKICDALPSDRLDFSCSQFHMGMREACPSTLIEGNVVYPRCKPHYHVDVGLDYRDRSMVCKNDGTWDRQFFTCSADCGKNSSSIKLIANGQRENVGGAPWNVAIYSTVDTKTPSFSCGGTLISVQLVLSAAHCFYDAARQKTYDEGLFDVAVGQYSRDFETKDIGSVKKYKIRKIYVPDEYIGEQTSYVGDIAIVRLADKISLSEQILPACVYWSDYTPFKPAEVTFGKLSGFGVTENGTLSSQLLTANLPYISYANCLKRLRLELKDSISRDKFCAGYNNGSGARSGDSGGGLLFLDEKQKLYYIRGVVSHQVESLPSTAAFTDVAQYLSWITTVVQDVNDSELKDDTRLGFKSKTNRTVSK